MSKILQKTEKKEKSLKKIKKPPVIEVISENNFEENKEEPKKNEGSEILGKEYPSEEYKYGFNDQFSDFFKDLQVFKIFINNEKKKLIGGIV